MGEFGDNESMTSEDLLEQTEKIAETPKFKGIFLNEICPEDVYPISTAVEAQQVLFEYRRVMSSQELADGALASLRVLNQHLRAIRRNRALRDVLLEKGVGNKEKPWSFGLYVHTVSHDEKEDLVSPGQHELETLLRDLKQQQETEALKRAKRIFQTISGVDLAKPPEAVATLIDKRGEALGLTVKKLVETEAGFIAIIDEEILKVFPPSYERESVEISLFQGKVPESEYLINAGMKPNEAELFALRACESKERWIKGFQMFRETLFSTEIKSA